MLKRFCFIKLSVPVLPIFPDSSKVRAIVKVIVIIANFHSMLFLAAATHSFITELA